MTMRKSIVALYGSDFEETLNSLGVLDKIRDGIIKCNECGKVITLDNLGSIKREGGALVICCLSDHSSGMCEF